MHNIILCGFMGCGKTTVGHRLSRLLSMEYIDLDKEIENDADLEIPAIFAQFGESHFRDLEHQAVLNISKRISCVVSTGGGAMTFARNIEAIDPLDSVVFLDVPFDVCYDRIKPTNRPIVQSKTHDQLQALYNERRKAYLAAADFRIVGALTADESAQSIAELIK